MSQTFAEVFAAHHHSALRLATRLTGGDVDLAEDVTAEAFARIHRCWRDGIDHPRAYVHRAVVNTATDRFRQRGRERDLLPRLFEPEGVTAHDEQLAQRDALVDALAGLPVQQRTVLVLRYFEDRSEAEIAALMGTSRGAVKSSAARGLSRLRARLAGPPRREGAATAEPADVAAAYVADADVATLDRAASDAARPALAA
ncbi:RNA polymerase sigma factor [Egicoccus halophilus]|uniref:RNA polymerase sigma-70 factor, sigma-E family n=1 Tax=Egicoccus halophilus TaxID=1670830 RepID=A0A8J3AHS4_9ACTN|nr:SigE family RNA polymerase sigma factor [Egicoccus halophilus]GGI09810.1 hypothetical protein GCM10011354_35920 [Egicoccus halophilus]